MSAFIRAVDRLSPTLAAAITYPFITGAVRRRPVRDRELTTHDAARRETIVAGGRRVVVYEWGSGPDVVLLVHGWAGRAAQFATIVRELLFEGYRVVAFDAPACGDSPGRRTHLGEFRAVVDALAARESHGLHAIVAHSAGALVAITAAVEDGISSRIVAIAPVLRFRALGEAFARITGFGERARLLQEVWLTARLRRKRVDLADRYDLIARERPAGLGLTIVHDPADVMADIEDSRTLAALHPGEVDLIEVAGLGHGRILEADVTLDAVLRAVGTPATSGALARSGRTSPRKDLRTAGRTAT
ncbi:MAG: alpha/beta fold hydrolase [Microbacterium sp.]